MPLICREILNFIEEKYPLSLAEDYDNVGLIIGNYNKVINRILVCLEVTDSVVMEAIKAEVDMIISHHPLIFRPIRRLTDKEQNSKVIADILKNDINLYCMHTNFDNAADGMNDLLAKALNLTNIDLLSVNRTTKLYKIAVYIPNSHLEPVRNAMLEAGGGFIGNYSHCSFSINGTGTFKPLQGASPFIGEVGSLEFTEEVKIETVVDSIRLNKVVQAMLKSHPYEEVAYDIYKLENENNYGTGRFGELKKPLEFDKFCDVVKKKLNISSIKVSGRMDKIVKKVAVVGGAGEDFIKDSLRVGSDVLITGDIKHHAALDASAEDLNIIDAGHYGTEILFVKFIADFIKEGLKIDCLESSIVTDPFKTL